MTPKDAFRIRKAVYGLLNAPRKWLEKLSKELKDLGCKQSALGDCVWRLFEGNRLVGILGVHVDDVVRGGNGKRYDEAIERLKKVFPFASWKSSMKEKVTFCGLELNQNVHGGITLSQERFSLGLNEINLTQERKQQIDDEASMTEKKAMRGLLGGLAWRTTQTAPWLSASTSILQGAQTTARFQDLLSVNKLCRLQRAHSEQGVSLSNDISDPMVLTFSDMSHANLSDLSSQGGRYTDGVD